jgi:tetratricopeptide (TPR) repeat protein
LGLAYYKAGDLENAQTEYEAIIKLTTGRLRYGDIYAKSFYMLGKIAEQQGDKGRAIENYRKFLDLWKDADPDRPEPADARKRLAAI